MSKLRPSQKWTSFDPWDYGDMKQRLEHAWAQINKSVIVKQAELVVNRTFRMSDPFSAGQYWICFELVAEDESLVIARVRLPRHPELLNTMTQDDEEYMMQFEVATMQYINHKLPNLAIPTLYAVAQPGSQLAMDAGAPYMLTQ